MFTSEIELFYNYKDDKESQLTFQLMIYSGTWPQITDETPLCFSNLMQRCWDPKPEKRPTSSEIYDE
ncbi:618_t:CDS:1, partial [Racocetra fulgida]